MAERDDARSSAGSHRRADRHPRWGWPSGTVRVRGCSAPGRCTTAGSCSQEDWHWGRPSSKVKWWIPRGCLQQWLSHRRVGKRWGRPISKAQERCFCQGTGRMDRQQQLRLAQVGGCKVCVTA